MYEQCAELLNQIEIFVSFCASCDLLPQLAVRLTRSAVADGEVLSHPAENVAPHRSAVGVFAVLVFISIVRSIPVPDTLLV